MGTQPLKYLMCQNIGENVGSFSLPIMATYLMKDHIEKWGVEVVEDTSKNDMKIKFVYVVKGKMTAPSFVEEVDIKKYYDDFIIVNNSRSSFTKDLNYVGPVILATKLDTNIGGRLMEFNFM